MDVSFLSLIVGVLLLVAALVDILWTTLWADGAAGPLSSRGTALFWRLLRRFGDRRPHLVSLAGPVILASTLAAWIALLWAGWVLLFAFDDGSLLDTTGDPGISWTGRIYFVAYAMFTMGNGDFRPAEGWPQIATALTTGTGMVIVTLSVTYLLSVVRAVAQKRSFAASVTGLGSRSEDVVRLAWDGQEFHSLDVTLSGFASDLALLADQHKAFPVLHYYHSEKREDASAVAVALLDDALTLLEHGVRDPTWNPVAVKSARSSVDNYLETLRSAFISPSATPPPAPDLDPLRAAGIPVVHHDVFAARVNELADRRRRLLGLVRGDAWEWSPNGTTTS